MNGSGKTKRSLGGMQRVLGYSGYSVNPEVANRPSSSMSSMGSSNTKVINPLPSQRSPVSSSTIEEEFSKNPREGFFKPLSTKYSLKPPHCSDILPEYKKLKERVIGGEKIQWQLSSMSKILRSLFTDPSATAIYIFIDG